MQLRFMGQTYTTSNNRVQTVASEQTATFKGQKYQIRVPVQTAKYQLNLQERKYRGVAYNTVEPNYACPTNNLQPCY